MKNLEMIPTSRRDAVRQALQITFGAAAINGFEPLAGGVSGAAILRFSSRERTYVLRVEPERIALIDRQRGFACMVAAAAEGAAPAVHFADPESGVVIMDFVAAKPLAEHPGGPLGAVRALGTLIAKVQATPPFPAVGSYSDVTQALLAKLGKSDLLTPDQLAPHGEGLSRIRDALSREASAQVSSHNDPNPRNILFDGERVLLVDWELAFRNDPLVDVAILTTELAETPELERALLEATFGVPPNGRMHARLAVVRLLTGCSTAVSSSTVWQAHCEPDPMPALRGLHPLRFAPRWRKGGCRVPPKSLTLSG